MRAIKHIRALHLICGIALAVALVAPLQCVCAAPVQADNAGGCCGAEAASCCATTVSADGGCCSGMEESADSSCGACGIECQCGTAAPDTPELRIVLRTQSNDERGLLNQSATMTGLTVAQDTYRSPSRESHGLPASSTTPVSIALCVFRC